MAAISIAFVAFFVQGIWCVPQGFGLSLGRGGFSLGGGGGALSLGSSGGGGNGISGGSGGGSGVLGAIGNMADMAGAGVNLGLQLKKAELGAMRSGIAGGLNAVSNGLNGMSNALKIPLDATSQIASGLKQSINENIGGSNDWESSVNFGSGGSDTSDRTTHSSTSKSSGTHYGVDIPSTDILRTMNYLQNEGVDLTKLVTDVGYDSAKRAINIGSEIGQNVIKNLGNSLPSWNGEYKSQGLTTGNDYTLNMKTPSTTVLKTMGKIIGAGMDITDQGVQLGKHIAKVGPEMLGKTSTLVKDTVKGMIGKIGDSISGSYNMPGSQSGTTTVTYKSGKGTNGGHSGSDYTYDGNGLNSGVLKSVENMVGRGMDMADQGVQWKAKLAKVGPEMLGQTSTVVKDTVKDFMGKMGDSISGSYNMPGSQSGTTTVTYKSGKGGNSGSEYTYDVNGLNSGVLKAMGNMVGAGMDMADQGFQLGNHIAKVGPEMLGKTSTVVKDTVKGMMGKIGDSISGSYNMPGSQPATTTVTYKSGKGANGGNSGSGYNYDVNGLNSGVMKAMGNVVGAGMDMADGGFQWGAKLAKVGPEMLGQTSTVVKDTVKGMMGNLGDSVSSSYNVPGGQSASTTITYKTGKNDGNSGSGYTYDVNGHNSGVMKAMGNVVGAGMDMANQGVQLGAKLAKVGPEMLGQTSTVVKDTVKGMMGNLGDSVSSSYNVPGGHSASTTITHKTGKSGSNSGSGYTYDVNGHNEGVMKTMGNMVGAGMDMVNQGVQMGAEGAKQASSIVEHTSSAVKDTVKGLVGNAGGHSGTLKAVENMVGSALEMGHQGVQMGTGGVNMGANLVGELSSSALQGIKGMVGANSKSGSTGGMSIGSNSLSVKLPTVSV